MLGVVVNYDVFFFVIGDFERVVFVEVVVVLDYEGFFYFNGSVVIVGIIVLFFEIVVVDVG